MSSHLFEHHNFIEFRGQAYDITAIGLVSQIYRKANKKNGFQKVDASQVGLAEDYLSRVAKPRKTVNKRFATDELARLATIWAGTRVMDGALIQAALNLGFEVVPDGPLSLKAYLRADYNRKEAK